MRFNTKEDIEAPIDFVFGKISDYPGFERSALRRGVDLQRKDGGGAVGVGSRWDLSFKFRGKERTAEIEIAEYVDPDGYTVRFVSGGVQGESKIELVPLTPSRTRMIVQVTLKHRTLAGRLLLQSFKLAKSSLNQRFKTRVADHAEDIETAYTGV